MLTMTDASVADASPPDVLFVPGGLGTRALQHDAPGQQETDELRAVSGRVADLKFFKSVIFPG